MAFSAAPPPSSAAALLPFTIHSAACSFSAPRLSLRLQPRCLNLRSSSSSSGRSTPTLTAVPHPTLPQPRGSTVVAFARRRKNSRSASAKRNPSQRNKSAQKNDEEDDNIDEDAFEALFNMLEEDLKNDNLLDGSDEDDEEITEEDLAMLEQELVEALGEDDIADVSGVLPLSSDHSDSDADLDEEVRVPALKNWQLKRLARALKIGRRKTSIKSLAAELGLDRALVLELLREPPPDLLLMSASLPDEVPQKLESESSSLLNEVIEPPEVENETLVSHVVDAVDDVETKPEVKLPVHVMRTKWSAQKRLKKVQVQTLERVYSRTKRPTNTMISSVVHVTNLPRKTVVKWFEDKRLQDGLPDQRAPFRRTLHDNVSPS